MARRHIPGMRLLFSLVLLLLISRTAAAQLIQREPARPLEEPKIKPSLSALLAKEPEGRVKVWVLFVDKGVTEPSQLSDMLRDVERTLPPRALLRRRKATRGEVASGFFDLPVSGEYMRKVLATGALERARSRWLNAVSVSATAREINGIARFPFVHSLMPVAGFVRTEPSLEVRSSLQDSRPARSRYMHEYGNSLAQVLQILVPPLHDMGYTGSGVLVGVLDTGFRKDHSALSGLDIVAEHDFVFDDDDTQYDPANPDDYSDFHGTGVLSIMAGNAELELVGPAFGASFLLGKTEDTRSETPIEEDYWVEGIEWMESQGADIVSSSLGYTRFDDGTGYEWSDLDGNTAVTTVAADLAASLGVLVVNAAGNERQNEWGHIITPADGDSVCAVGAVDAQGMIAPFSSPGPTNDGRTKPEICAMGVADYFALNVDTVSYGYGSGTSFATPLVAGASALLLEVHPEWSAMELLETLKGTASQNDAPDNDYGWGIVNALRAADLDEPYVLLLEWAVDDDSTGESLGNGNGFPEGGETVELQFFVTNPGDTAAIGLTAVLRAGDPYVTLLDSTETFPDLAPDDTASCDDDFGFSLSDSIPPVYAAPFTLIISDGEAREWEYSFELATGSLFRLAGEIRGPDVSPLPFATALVLGPIDSAGRFDQGVLVPADEEGRFESYVHPGRYSAQALDSGYLMSDAFLVTLPPDTSLLFQLTSPELSLDADSAVIYLDGGLSAADTIRITNTGSGLLTFSIQEANYLALSGAPHGASLVSRTMSPGRGGATGFPSGPSRPTAPDAVSRILLEIARGEKGRMDGSSGRKVLREKRLPRDERAVQPVDTLWNFVYWDTDQKTDMDIKALFSQFEVADSMLYLRLGGWRPWRDVPGEWWGAFLIDADTNPSTGSPFLGDEYLLLRDPFFGAYILEWIEAYQDYEFLDYLPYEQVQDSLFELGVGRGLIELSGPDPELMYVYAGFLWPVELDTVALNDALPDDGGSMFAAVSVHDDEWLAAEPQWETLLPGESRDIVISASFDSEPPGTMRASLVFVSNTPLSAPVTLPVVVHPPSGVRPEEPETRIPTIYSLSQNYPNPFNPVTSIRYDVPAGSGEKAKVLLRIYDLRGRLVATLVDAEKQPGTYSAVWDGRDEKGTIVPSGIYFYRMNSGGFTSARKMVMIQ